MRKRSGHFLYRIAEKVTGRPPKLSYEEAVTRVRFYLENDHHAVLFFTWEFSHPFSKPENDQVVEEFVDYLVRMNLVHPKTS